MTLGDSEAARCTLVCNGQGPIISAQPLRLDWEEIGVLQESTKTVTLINDSPIPADFHIAMVIIQKIYIM